MPSRIVALRRNFRLLACKVQVRISDSDGKHFAENFAFYFD